MIDFFQNLKTRNETLFYYGLVCQYTHTILNKDYLQKNYF